MTQGLGVGVDRGRGRGKMKNTHGLPLQLPRNGAIRQVKVFWFFWHWLMSNIEQYEQFCRFCEHFSQHIITCH